MVQAIKAAKLADLIRDYLASWTSQDLLGYFFSITQVTLSTDLQQATAWVDVLTKEKEGEIMRELQRNISSYQRKLHGHLKRHTVPHLVFKLDEGHALSLRMDELLGK